MKQAHDHATGWKNVVWLFFTGVIPSEYGFVFGIGNLAALLGAVLFARIGSSSRLPLLVNACSLIQV